MQLVNGGIQAVTRVGRTSDGVPREVRGTDNGIVRLAGIGVQRDRELDAWHLVGAAASDREFGLTDRQETE